MKIKVTSGQAGQALARAKLMPDDKRDPALIANLERVHRQIPTARLNTTNMHADVIAGKFQRPDQKQALSSMYMQEYFGQKEASLPVLTKSMFGKEMSVDEAFDWTSTQLNTLHGLNAEQQVDKARETVTKRKRKEQVRRSVGLGAVGVVPGVPGATFAPPTKPVPEAGPLISDEEVEEARGQLPQNRILRLEAQLTPKQERLGRFIAVTSDPMESMDALMAMEPEDRANTVQYISELNPERDLGWWQQVAPRVRDAAKRSAFSIARTVKGQGRQAQRVAVPVRTFSAIEQAFPDNTLPDGGDVFNEAGEFASEESKAAVHALLVERLNEEQENRSVGLGVTGVVPGVPGATFGAPATAAFSPGHVETADELIDQVPEAYRVGRRQHVKRGVERQVFHNAELDRFKEVPFDSGLKAVEMAVDMAAALVATAAVGPAGGVAYSYARVQSELQDSLQYDHGVNPDAAFVLATAAAFPTALFEYAQIKGVSRAAKPAQAKFMSYLQGNWKRLLGDTVKQRGVTIVEEIGEESAQSLIEQTMKAAAREFADAEGVDYRELAADWLRDTKEAATVMPWMMGPAMGLDATAVGISALNNNMRPGDPAKLHEIGVEINRLKKDFAVEGPAYITAGVLREYTAARGTSAKQAVLQEAGLETRTEDFAAAESVQALEGAYAAEEGRIETARQAAEAEVLDDERGDVTSSAAGVDTSAVEALQERARGAMELETFEKQEDLPQDVQDALEPGARPLGYYQDGKVHLIRENLGSEDAASFTWAHEQAHGAVEALGSARDVLLAKVEDLSGGTERMATLMPELDAEGAPQDVTHEFIAKLAEQQLDPKAGKLTGPKKVIWQKMVDWAHDWLGVTSDQKLNDREVANIVRGLMQNVFEQQAEPAPDGGLVDGAAPRFSTDQDWNERESAVTVALRMIAGEDMTRQAAEALLQEHFGADLDVGETLRRAQSIVRTVEASGDLLEADQREVNRAVRQAERGERYSARRERGTAYLKGVYDEQARAPQATKRAPSVKTLQKKVETRDKKLAKQKQDAQEKLAVLKKDHQRKTMELKNEISNAKKSAQSALTDQRKDIVAKISALEAHIKSKMPVGRASDIMRKAENDANQQIKKLASVTSAAARENRLEEAAHEIDRIFYKAQRRDTIANIDKILKTKVPKVGKNKVLRGDPLTPEIHDRLNSVREAWAMRGSENWNLTHELQGELEEIQQTVETLQAAEGKEGEYLTAVKKRDKIRDRLWAHEMFGDITGKSRSLTHVITAHKELTELLATGRTSHDTIEQMFRQEVELDKWNAIEGISRGQETPDTKATAREASYDEIHNAIYRGLDTFDTMHHSFEFLLDKIIEPGEGILKGPITQKYSRLMHKATVAANKNKRHYTKMINNKQKEIYGVDSDFQLMKVRYENSKRVQDTGVYEYLHGEKSERQFALSKNEAYKFWQLWQDPTLRPALIKHGTSEQTIKEIEKFIGPKTKAWAKWQLEEFFPSYYHSINKIYRRMFSVNMPFNPKYSPVYRKLLGIDQAKEIGEQDVSRPSILSMSHKARTDNVRDFAIMDGDTVLHQHIADMEHFKAFAEPTKQMNAVFRSGDVQESLQQHAGKKAQKVLNTQLEDFVRGGVDRAQVIGWADKIRANYTKAVVGLKLPIFFKQLTSHLAYAMDMPVDEFVKGQAAFWKDPIKAIKTLSTSDYMIDRYDKGWDRDVILSLKATQPKGPIGQVYNNLTNRGMFLTKLGDKAAILSGGYSVYNYHYNLQKEAGKSDAVAHEEAILQFEMATSRTQQAGEVMDLGHYQRGNSWQKLFTMFSTSPISYHRSVSAGIRTLAGKKGGDKKEAAKRVIIGHFILPAIFTMIANAGRWDDEDQLRAAILGSFNRLFMVGEVSDALLSAIISKDIRAASGILQTPMGDAGEDIIRGAGKLFKDADLTMEDIIYATDKIGSGASKFAGVPYAGARGVVKGLGAAASGDTDFPIRRALGFSPYALDEQ